MKRFAVLLVAVACLSACQKEPAPPAAAPEAKPGLSVTAARLVLPAVKGNPAAAYFTVTNNAGQPATLAAVFIDGAARAEMHDMAGLTMTPIKTLDLKPQESVTFKSGGKHVMAFDLDPSLTVGGKSEITLTFADGDKVSAPMTIEPAGGAEEHMH